MSEPLIISAGMPRAGSGWYFNLLHDLVVSSGGQNSREVRPKFHLEPFLTEVNCNISTLSSYRLIPVLVPTFLGSKYVVKTHAGPTPTARYLIRKKRIFVVYIYRDPRAALLSAYEYGQRAVERNRPNAFSHLQNLEDAAEFIDFYIRIWDAWSRIEDVLILRYEDLLSNYQGAIDKTAQFINLDLGNPTSLQVIEDYLPGKGDPGKIGTHFSKGKAERFRTEIGAGLLANFTQKFEPSLLRMGYDK